MSELKEAAQRLIEVLDKSRVGINSMVLLGRFQGVSYIDSSIGDKIDALKDILAKEKTLEDDTDYAKENEEYWREGEREASEDLCVPVSVLRQIGGALELAIGYPYLVARGVGKMPILKGSAKSDCDILSGALKLLEPYLEKP